MTTPVWQLKKGFAWLEREALSARLDLREPAKGLHRFGSAAAAFADAGLLGIEIPSSAARAADLPVKKHVRGDDLVVAYGPTEAWPVCMDAVWRAVAAAESDRAAAAVELLVSVAAQHGEIRPALTVRTVLAADEVLRLADPQAGRFRALPAAAPWALGPGEGPGCLLFRRHDAKLSYAEMIHPADFNRDELTGATGPETPFALGHRLFPQVLDRGVILRARLRGVFCRRADDTAIAAETYCRLAAAEPPLSTY